MEQFYKAYLNTVKMLHDRMYITEKQKEELFLKPAEFVNIKNKDISKLDIKHINTRDGKPVYVAFYDDNLSNYSRYTMILELLKIRLTEDIINNYYIIVVYQSNEDDDTEKILKDIIKKEKEFIASKRQIQLFPSEILAIDLLNNIVMPKVELITDLKEKAEILEMGKLSMNSVQLSDPLTRYFGATSNDIFKIIRKGKDGPSISWRRVA